MKPRHRELIRRISRAIADSRQIDWTEPDDADDELRHRLLRLRAIHNLADAFRTLPPAASGEFAGVEGRAETADPPETELADTLFTWGPLLVREKLGEGSFGEVFRAFDPVLRRDVALKLKRAAGSGSLGTGSLAHLEEARRLARVRHPNVLTVHGIEVHDGRAGLWTELVRGETLEALLDRSGPQRAEEIVTTGVELCRALAAVHATGITHGDVKAANVMVDSGGRVILMDFGAGSLQGTPLAMAPELFAGSPPSVATDIYALGVLLFRLATGRYPVTAASEEELIARLRRGERMRLRDARPDLPEALTRVIEQAAATEPEARFRSAAEMEAALESSLDLPLRRTAELARPSVPNNLPAPRDRFVGREQDRRLVRRRLSSARLVTIAGAGGCGKTRLAWHVAADMSSAFPSGVWWIDLTAVRATDPIWGEVARLLGLRESVGISLERAVLECLRDASVLLILDNCEHLPAASRSLAETVLRECPGARILATSRRPLGAEAESIYRLRPLEVPPPISPTTAEFSSGAAATMRGGLASEVESGSEPDLLAYDSVRLFVDRAARSRPDFVLSAANAPAIARICRRLDGIPLAIELAAARARALPVQEIEARLERSFRILEQPSSERPTHHRTLAVCIDWSYGLLSTSEQALLRRLAVFSGGWTLEASERICADSEEAPGVIGGEQVLNLLEGLIDHSLVQFHPPDAEVTAPDGREAAERHSYSMLETIRQYAQELLEASGEEAGFRDRHRDHFLALTERAEARLRGSDQEAWVARLESERGNLNASLAWSARSPSGIDKGIPLLTNLRGFWLMRGYLSEGLGHCRQILERTDPAHPLRGRALFIASSLAWRRGEYDIARRLCEEANAGWRAAGDESSLCFGLGLLGTLSMEQGRLGEARAELTEAMELTRRLRGRKETPGLLNNLGVICADLGDFAAAAAHYEEALSIYREVGNSQMAATVLGNLAAAAMDLGDLPKARSLAEEGVATLRRTANRSSLAGALRTLGRVALRQRDLDRSREALLESLALDEMIENRQGVADDLLALGYLSEAEGRTARAVRLLAAAESIREQIQAPLPPHERGLLEQASDQLRAALGSDAFAAMRAEGRRMSLAESLAFAQGRDDGP